MGPRYIVTLLCLALTTACAKSHTAAPTQPGEALVVLLPDDDSGKTGRARVFNNAGSVNLESAREATLVKSNTKPSDPERLSPDEVKDLFGDALAALPPALKHFTLEFRFDSEQLTDESQQLLQEVLKAVKARPVPDVVVVGHTDTMGDQAANYRLGMRRSMTVRNLLISAGLAESSVEAVSHGESDPLVKTPDETPEQRNRRVEISVR